MIICPECNGLGYIDYERPVLDRDNGGYLEEYTLPCETCEGEGEIPIED